MFGINNPQRLLQPWTSIGRFAEELYAMLTENAPPDSSGATGVSPPRRAADDQGGPVRPAGGDDTVAAPLPRPAPGVDVAGEPQRQRPPRTPPPGTTAEQLARRAPRPVEPYKPKPFAAACPSTLMLPGSLPMPTPALTSTLPALVVPPIAPNTPVFPANGPVGLPLGTPIIADGPPALFDPTKQKWFDVPWFPTDMAATAPDDGGGSSTVLIGQVVSGGPSPVTCNIYPDGPANAVDPAGPYSVTIQGLDPSEQFASGEWIYGIYQLSDSQGNDAYYAQVPTWAGGSTSGS